MADPSPLTVAPTLPPVRGVPEPPVAANLAAALAMLALAAVLLYAGTRTSFGAIWGTQVFDAEGAEDAQSVQRGVP
jgi:hypothetical protein